MVLLVVLGEGGHTSEMLRLLDLLGSDYTYHYVVAREDSLSPHRIRRPGPVHLLCRPRGKQTGLLMAGVRTARATLESLRIVLKVRPAAVLSSGPAIAVPISVLGKILGVQIIFVETGSRVRRLSLTGRMMYPLADLFFVQWQPLQEQLPRAIYAGRLL